MNKKIASFLDDIQKLKIKNRKPSTCFLVPHGNDRKINQSKIKLRLRRDSNPYQWYRKPSFYPLNYGGFATNIEIHFDYFRG